MNDENDYDVLSTADAKAWVAQASLHPEADVTPEFMDETVHSIESGLMELRRNRETGVVTIAITERGNALIDNEDPALRAYLEEESPDQ